MELRFTKSDLIFFLDNEKFSDVVINLRTRSFRAHKIILSLMSDYFSTLLSDSVFIESSQSSIDINLENIDPDVFHLVLRLMYGEKLEFLDWRTKFNILLLAKFLSLKGISVDDEVLKINVPASDFSAFVLGLNELYPEGISTELVYNLAAMLSQDSNLNGLTPEFIDELKLLLDGDGVSKITMGLRRIALSHTDGKIRRYLAKDYSFQYNVSQFDVLAYSDEEAFLKLHRFISQRYHRDIVHDWLSNYDYQGQSLSTIIDFIIDDFTHGDQGLNLDQIKISC